ncbi:Mov34/MPN/PAD-1 family protein [Tautonia sociabilis]|uniref:Metal-dependent protease of the PAD1/JAB1 superfamily n=1 Tax=Tautonia sociabilis TaxID=2080755 RepID=A0A432MNQ8_9BACT|nr:Mov34/MPN/PAD-1 family protein [Tautonia sociabilis]RUL89042.1 metal-dependent protease of the PAD1/JAB1 superfamily [Tautonia sociabilis]
MSTESDDIQFEEVSYREPKRLKRPDRDRSFASLAYGTPGPEDLAIFIERETVDAIERHALSDVSVELGGILLGRECVDEETGKPFVWVSQALEAKHYENTQASFTYTHDSWQEITRERDRRFPDLDIVGWYHTHPDFGIFLSGHDVFIQQHFFGQPLQVAYVVDPIRQTRGFFQWRGDALRQVEGYYLVAPREHRVALARTVNELEGVQDAGLAGGIGALSPRLEAELIAMLNRPHAVSASTDRGQSAAVFSLLGMVLGAVAVALTLWIASLSGQLREQSRTLASLREELARANRAEESSEAIERVRAKEQALDALLREVRLGDSNERFLEIYNRLHEERDRAVAEAALVEQVGLDLIEKQRQIQGLEEEVARRDEALKQLDALKTRSERLELQNELLVRRLEEAGQPVEGNAIQEPGPLTRKYSIAWYAAVAGWGVAVLLGLGIVAVVARTLPMASDVSPSPPDRGHSPEAPHRIE